MLKVVRNLFLVLILISALVRPAVSADYLGIIREAVSNIELGDYNSASSDIEKARAVDDCDPLGYYALGIVYMHTGKLAEAESVFNKILAMQPNDWRAEYAIGLIGLAQNDNTKANKYLTAARTHPGSQDELAALDSYQALMHGKNETRSNTLLPLAMETAAIQALKTGNRDVAISLLKSVLSTPAPLGFDENRAPLATFDAKNPIYLPKGKLTWKPTERKGISAVSGTLTLRADTSRSNGMSYVSYYVDDSFCGATNYEPFNFDWDTTRFTNGSHKIKMEAKNDAGAVVSAKTVWVRVYNSNPPKTAPHTGVAVDALMARLWNCIRLTESRKVAHYNLAKLYLDENDKDKAMSQLEYTVAYDPNYEDARMLLARMRRGAGPWIASISKGHTGSNMIALTFDDGPNERTTQLLDMLKKLRVPATFFVVGIRAEIHPELVSAMVAGGHEVENHTYTHPNLTKITVDQVESELTKDAAVIRAITGKPSLYYRPPGGHANPISGQAAAREGLTGVFWSVICSPYEGANSQKLADHVINTAADGGVVLMHNGEPATVSALPKIVDSLRKKGFKFVTISELMGGGPI